MAEVAERVTRLEERFDGVAMAIADLKVAVSDLDANMRAGFAEARSESVAIRAELGSASSAARAESAEIRAEMNHQFRWIMGGIGSAALAILLAVLGVLGAILSRG